MATITREVLNADGMATVIFCGGLSRVGLGLLGTWAGTVAFYGSVDGINFFALSMTPFASGTDVSSATANGNFFADVKNLMAVKVVFTRTSGSAQVVLAAANDASWQDAFLTASTVFNSSSATSGANTLTQAAQANRAWNLQFLEVSLAGLTFPGGAGRVDVYDGTIAGTKLYTAFLSSNAGSVGSVQKINLPESGITNTPGNAMTIVVSGLGAGQSSVINTKFSAA